MTRPDQDIIQIIADEIDEEASSIERDTRLVEDLGMDSLDAVHVVLELEDLIDKSITDAEFERCHTVGDVIDLVRRLSDGEDA